MGPRAPEFLYLALLFNTSWGCRHCQSFLINSFWTFIKKYNDIVYDVIFGRPLNDEKLTCGFMTTYKIGFQQTEVFAVRSGTMTTAGGTNLKAKNVEYKIFLKIIIFFKKSPLSSQKENTTFIHPFEIPYHDVLNRRNKTKIWKKKIFWSMNILKKTMKFKYDFILKWFQACKRVHQLI